MKGKICRLCIALLCLLASCSEEENSNEIVITPADYSVKGKVEKGPFIKGSTISLQPLDAKMNPLGTSYSGVIIDNEGSFDLGTLKLDAPYALLITDGFFYNEVQGQLSDSRITLQAIVDLKDHSTVNVNLLTHLAKERIKHLIAKGASFHDANKQAQKELLTNFGLQKYAETDVAQFSIAAGTNEAAALLVVSAAIIKERSEAQLTEYLGQLSLDFTENGKFTDEQKDVYRKATLGLDYSTIAANVINRYKELKKDIEVKDLSYFVDYDGNGIAGDELGDPDTPVELAFEQTTLDVPKDGGTYTIKIRSNVPYSLTYPLDEKFVEDEVWGGPSFFKITPVVYEKELSEETNELILKIEPAGSMLMSNAEITLYSMDGEVRSRLTIRQESDLDKYENILDDGGKSYFASIFLQMLNPISYLHTIDGLYTKSYQTTPNMGSWCMFQNDVPVYAFNNELMRTWTDCYAIINRVLYLNEMIQKQTIATDVSFILDYTACIQAALYYEMAVIWENLPYVDRAFSPTYPDVRIPASPSADIFEKVGNRLHDRSKFSDKKNDFSLMDIIFVSKDVPAALLAKMYLYQKDYSKAYQLLNEIIDNGHYQLESSRSAALSKSSREMIYGLPIELPEEHYRYPTQFILGVNDDFMPLITYTEVVLSAAECAWKLKDETKAYSYLNNVLNKRNLKSSGDFGTDLKNVWRNEMKGMGAYFAFLKRNGWAMDEMQLRSEHMLLLPIPSQVLDQSPELRQNPGY